MKRLVIDYNPHCTFAALAYDGELIDFSVERTEIRGIVGNIYKGRVENVLGGMKAAFVNIGLERNGFLYVGESLVDSKGLQSERTMGELNVSAGDIIMCQVVKDQFGQKGPRLTTDVTLPGYYLVLLPRSSFIGVSRKIEDNTRREYLENLVKSVCPPNMGFIIRSAAERARDEDIKAEAVSLITTWERVQKDYYRAQDKSLVFEEASLFERAIRDTFNEDVDVVVINDATVAAQLRGKVGGASIEVYNGERNIMSHFGLTEQINHLCDHRVDLINGAYIVIDKTEALTVIDVNTGRFVGSKDLEDTVYHTNLVAAECIAKQLRLRNISGIVVIDFIDMLEQKHRDGVIEALKCALKNDRMKTSSVEMTSLGLVELTRKKTRLPIDDFMLQPCQECDGGFVISSECLAFRLRDELIEYIMAGKYDTVLVKVYPDVYNAVLSNGIMSRELKTIWANKTINILADASIKRTHFEMSGSSGDKKLVMPLESKTLK